jgi:stress-induced morphogen
MAGHARRATRAGSAIHIRFMISAPRFNGRRQVSAWRLVLVKVAGRQTARHGYTIDPAVT